MKRFLQPGSVALVAVFSFLLLAGCSAAHYRKSADKEAYRAVAQKTPQVKNMDEHFTIEQTNQLSLDGLPVAAKVQDFLGPDGEAERGARVISLETALDIAVNQRGCCGQPAHHVFVAGGSQAAAPAVAKRRIQKGNRESDAGGARLALRAARFRAVPQDVQRPGCQRPLRRSGQSRHGSEQFFEPAKLPQKRRANPRARS